MFKIAGLLGIGYWPAAALLTAIIAGTAAVSPLFAAQVLQRLASFGFSATTWY